MDYIRDLPRKKEEEESISISEEVIAIIASKAAMEVNGVASMSGGIGNEIVNMLGRENLAKGVKVTTTNDTAIIDVFVIIRYGFRIPDVAWDLQENVKAKIEEMTDIDVKEVNINIQGIDSETL